jgi:hypothetical protein
LIVQLREIDIVRYDDQTIDTGLEDLYAIDTTFRGELDTSQVPNFFNIEVKNNKGTTY